MASSDDTVTKRRRPHNKAKTGCAACRVRRVKCDEQRPKCRACVRRKVHCQYPAINHSSPSPSPLQQSPASTLDGTNAQQSTQGTPIRSLPSLSTTQQWLPASGLQDPPHDVFGIHEMALFHHWVISTSLEMFKAKDVSVCWQVLFPQIAFQHVFVMHAILSLAALHLAFLNPTEKRQHMADAARHHTTALQGFQQALGELGPGNSDALFVWTTVNLLYVFGMSGRLSDDADLPSNALSRKDRVLGVEWIPMIRGIEAVLSPFHVCIQTGLLTKLTDVGNWFELDPGADSDPQDIYFRRISASWNGSPDTKTYDDALWTLRKCRAYIAQFATFDQQTLESWGFNREPSGPLMFIHFAPSAYFLLLEQRQPAALVLFAFFGALLKTVDHCCFMEGWGHDIVATVDDSLGTYWRPWIEWPVHMVGLT